jgi:hypothetical protein
MRIFAVTIVVAGLVGFALSGCKRKEKEEEDPKPASDTPAQPQTKPHPSAHPAAGAPHQPHPQHPQHPPSGDGAPALGEKVEIPQAQVVFNAPGGWKKNMTSNGWALFRAPDNNARLGYVAFTQPGEATSRLGQLAETFELTNLTWGSPSEGFVGRDRFPDHEGDTKSCTLRNGDACDMRYMTINPGGSVQIMVVYLVDIVHGEPLRSHATASVASLRRM